MVLKGVGKTVFLDWALSFGAGLLFALAGRRELASSGSLFGTRAFRWGLAYLHLGVLAISITLYAIEPAWMWMYWVDPARLPLVGVIMVFLLYEACYVAGFVLASEIERRRANATWILAGAMFVAISIAEFATRVRLFHFGSFEEFAAGAAPLGLEFNPFHLEPAMAIVLGPGLLATAAIVILARHVWLDDRRRFGAPAPVEVSSPEYTPS